MSTPSSNIEQSDIKVLFISGSALILMALSLAALGIWLLVDSHRQYSSLLYSRAHLLIQHTGLTINYAGFPIFLGMSTLGACLIWVGLRRKRFSNPVNKKIMKWATVLIIAGVIGMFVGRYIANTLWAETFENAGYAKCSGSFSITKQWSTVVWAADPSLCTDEKVRDMFRSFEHDLSDINAYLQANRGSGEPEV